MVDVVSYLPKGGPMAQVCRLGPRVGGRLVLFCIHRVNRLYGAHGHVTVPYKLSYHYYYYYYYYKSVTVKQSVSLTNASDYRTVWLTDKELWLGLGVRYSALV